MGIFNKEPSQIKTVSDFANASKEEQDEKLKDLEKIKFPQLNINHTIDWELLNKTITAGNNLQSENDQQTKN